MVKRPGTIWDWSGKLEARVLLELYFLLALRLSPSVDNVVLSRITFATNLMYLYRKSWSLNRPVRIARLQNKNARSSEIETAVIGVVLVDDPESGVGAGVLSSSSEGERRVGTVVAESKDLESPDGATVVGSAVVG